VSLKLKQLFARNIGSYFDKDGENMFWEEHFFLIALACASMFDYV
jgi:hypothetical protein